MGEEITLKHIEDAIRYIKNEPIWVVGDEFVKVEMSHPGAKKVTLKPLGKALVDKFLRDTESLGTKGEIVTIFGMPVVVSDKVKGVELRCKWP